jgi:methylglyoxal synthase
MGKVALVAHDAKKLLLVDWVGQHVENFMSLDLISTGTTGKVLLERFPALRLERFESGPLGGDQQIGSRIVAGGIDALFFFIDPLTPMPHDVDVKALLRLAILYDIPCAFAPRTADLILAGVMRVHLARGPA